MKTFLPSLERKYTHTYIHGLFKNKQTQDKSIIGDFKGYNQLSYLTEANTLF